MTPAHRLTVRVYYEDTDFSGVVYHANYLRFLERGRTELLRTVGIAGRSLFEAPDGGTPVAFVVHRMAIDWRAAARMDDLVTVETQVADVRGASARMDQRIVRDATVLVTAAVSVAVVRDGRAVRFPPEIRSAFLRALGS